MQVAILYNEATADAAIDEQDVVVQRDAVAAALAELQHSVVCLGCTLNLQAAKTRLAEIQPDVVFNLVESLGGTDRLLCLAMMLLDALGLPYTGSHTPAALLSTDKLAAKKRLREAGLPTPDWLAVGRIANPSLKIDGLANRLTENRVIIKSVWEHASFGIHDAAVATVDSTSAVEQLVRKRTTETGRPHFAERFVTGREFNLSLLAGPDGPQALPPAEIDFSTLPPDKPRIVGYQAKWDSLSPEYVQTPRRFEFPSADQALLQRLADLAKGCWNLFGLRGYARVDFRVDETGEPWILEINANPCLSPDAGFAAALQRGGIDYNRAVQRILDDATEETADL